MTDDPSDPSPRRRRGTFRLDPGKPLQFTEEAPGTDFDEQVDEVSSRLILTFRAYRKAATELLDGRYAAVRQHAPAHLRDPCDVFVLKCTDGLLVRYDVASTDNPTVRAATLGMTLQEAAPKMSEGFLHLPDDPSVFVVPQDGPTMVFCKVDMASGATEPIVTMRPVILGSTKLAPGVRVPPPPARPLCTVSITNEFDIVLGGVMTAADKPPSEDATGQRFVARGRISVPAAWRAIEVYPTVADDHWKPEYAPLWAELDVQAAVVQRNLQNTEFLALDSRGETRRKWAALLSEFESLLSGAEEPLHQFLKAHPELLSPTHEQSWSKLKFGDHVSDFVFREPTNDYELVEIEAPVRPLFRKDGHPRHEINHAIAQTRDWVQYISANRERVERESGLDGISANPRTLVVIGRSADVTAEQRQTLVTMQALAPKLRILTYDDVLALARTNLERILGPLGFAGQSVEFHYY